MTVTLLTAADRLPLTCTRLGTCCHGHQIFISPWELARLARGLGLAPHAFRDRHTDSGGIRLIANGPLGTHGPPAHFGKPACTFYDAQAGCTVHPHRPLACRLYPLGRERHQGAIRYYHPGREFPCIALCPTVTALPSLSVGEHLAGQEIAAPEAAHDGYSSLAYGMIKAAAVIAARAPEVDAGALRDHFRTFAALTPQERPAHIPAAWLDLLTIPAVTTPLEDPAAFVAAHGQALATALQQEFGTGARAGALADAARLHVALALHLGTTVGTDPGVMAELLAAPATT
jgi:Fe-S-cluster containining protein